MTHCWKLRTQTLPLGKIPLLLGVVNVTPDSFSDGGHFFDTNKAIDHALNLVAAGANLLDIGGQSTRPSAEPVTVEEELRRVLPVIEGLRRQTDVPLSIDTFQPEVAEVALAAGVELLNDIQGFTQPKMIELALLNRCGLCAMHMQGKPQTMQKNPHYHDVVAEVFAFLKTQRDTLLASGVEAERIALDPGIGFGKTLDHNLALLNQIERFHQLGSPLLVGYSRKRFITQLVGEDESARLAGGLGVALALTLRGVQILRVHDVAETASALKMFLACTNLESQ